MQSSPFMSFAIAVHELLYGYALYLWGFCTLFTLTLFFFFFFLSATQLAFSLNITHKITHTPVGMVNAQVNALTFHPLRSLRIFH